ncbi:sugar ABC transporter substrate-binding protein [Pseudonocardia hispaniensis]|uniref:Sugar ABC transporter substrate-binding protein n=1 Tax=Pseudonocardia hispaniensis TaxID=904933 RepID=A0ABW1IZ69_9PSEU
MHNIKRSLAAMLTAGAVVAALGACSSPGAGGSGQGGASGDVPAVVAENLAKYRDAAPPDYAGEPFDASPAKGKQVWWVTMYSGNPFLAAVGANFKAALEHAGVEVTTCDGKSNPVDYNNCISQAVAQGADAIQVDGPEAATYANALAEANAAGIPVLSGAAVDASGELHQGLAGQSSQAFVRSGELVADWIVADSGGSANVLFLTTPDVIGSLQEQEAFSARMTEVCPACTVTVKGVTIGNWASDLGPTTSAELTRNPTIDYVVPAFDPMTQFTNPAIQQAGKSGQVKVATINGSYQPMRELADGGLVAAEIGNDLNALGYIEADLVLRALVGAPTVQNAIAPVRIFDSNNVGELALSPETTIDGSWYAGQGVTADYFARLWAGT